MNLFCTTISIGSYLIYAIQSLTSILSGLQTLTVRQIENSTVPPPPQPDIAPLLYYIHDEMIQINTMITSLSTMYIYNIEIYSVLIQLLKIYIQIMNKDMYRNAHLFDHPLVSLYFLLSVPICSLFLPIPTVLCICLTLLLFQSPPQTQSVV